MCRGLPVGGGESRSNPQNKDMTGTAVITNGFVEEAYTKRLDHRPMECTGNAALKPGLAEKIDSSQSNPHV